MNFFTAPAGTAGKVGSTSSNGSKSIPLASARVGAAATAAAGVAVGAAACCGMVRDSVWPEPARANAAMIAVATSTTAMSPRTIGVQPGSRALSASEAGSARPSTRSYSSRESASSSGCVRVAMTVLPKRWLMFQPSIECPSGASPRARKAIPIRVRTHAVSGMGETTA